MYIKYAIIVIYNMYSIVKNEVSLNHKISYFWIQTIVNIKFTFVNYMYSYL